MNKVTISPHNRVVVFEIPINRVVAEAIRIKSDFYYLQASYPADFPKEREK